MKMNIKKIKITPELIGFSAFIPGTKLSEKEFENLKYNVHYLADVKRPRNIKHHDLAFALASFLSENAPEDSAWNNCDPYKFLKAIMHEAGITDFYMDMKGEIITYAKSISFETMDEEEFSKVSDLIFCHVARILRIDENYLRKNYKKILDEGTL